MMHKKMEQRLDMLAHQVFTLKQSIDRLVAQEDARTRALAEHQVELLSEHRDKRGRFTKQADR